MPCAVVLWVVISLATVTPSHAQQAEPTIDPNAQILNPIDGSQLFGVITITGSATNSGLQSYRLDYLTIADPASGWQPIGRPVTQQVRAGTLGQWDTTTVKDGAYEIRLRLVLRNGTVLEDYVRGLTVQNQAPTALPTQPPPPTNAPPPTAGPSSTPFIQQPPTPTSRQSSFATAITLTGPTAVQTSLPARTLQPAATVSTTPPALGPNTVGSGVGGDALRSSLCSGAFLAVIGFGVYGLYNFLRRRRR